MANLFQRIRELIPTRGPIPAVCRNDDGALTNANYIFVTAPTSGTRVAPGFVVRGCSSTHEGHLEWTLLDRMGNPLANGHASGGSMGDLGYFSFPVSYSLPLRQIGHLVVTEEDVSDGEGNPPPRNVIPLVLQP